MPLQLQRELVDGIPSDILPKHQGEGNVVSPLNHPTKPFVLALSPEAGTRHSLKHDCASFELCTPVIDGAPKYDAPIFLKDESFDKLLLSRK